MNPGIVVWCLLLYCINIELCVKAVISQNTGTHRASRVPVRVRMTDSPLRQNPMNKQASPASPVLCRHLPRCQKTQSSFKADRHEKLCLEGNWAHEDSLSVILFCETTALRPLCPLLHSRAGDHDSISFIIPFLRSLLDSLQGLPLESQWHLDTPRCPTFQQPTPSQSEQASRQEWTPPSTTPATP
jgi:hypothetical protein